MLVGIILIQQRLLARVERLNQEAFDAAVYRSLGAVVKQVEEKENFSFINREISGDTVIHSAKNLKVIKSSSSGKIHRASISNNIKISLNNDSGKLTKTVIRIEKDNNGKQTVENSIIINSGENLEVPVVPPVPPVPPAHPIPEEKIENIEVLVKKMSHIKDTDSITIKPEDLRKILLGQLKQNDLPDSFSFCLLTKEKNSFCETDPAVKDGWRPYKANLYPNDLFGRDVTLVLMLNAKDTIKRSGVSWMFFLSIFFTLAILTLFVYSIRMIIKHRKLLEMKNDFINHMSHEFKTPLAGISLGADMLINNPEKMSAEQIDKVARIIRRQSDRLDQEITDVLLSAQLEENIAGITESFNLVDTIKLQIELFQFQLENKNAKIETHFDSDTITMTGNKMFWGKIFSNLLDNALKFSRENPEINITVSNSNHCIKILFSDNGIGIAQKDLPHIFEKFYRSNYYKQSNIRGFGLGLNFVKKVVDSHKGAIRAESELGKGTKIIIELNA